jgi:drug/metabolite transporter (DMT)-like permease
LFPPELLRAIAILLAVFGAVFLSLGAQFQNDAVGKHHVSKQVVPSSLSLKQVLNLLKRPRWLTGTSFLVLAVVFQLGALALAPLIVVQPIGALALIITSMLNARINKVRLDLKTFLAIGMTMFGVGTFVFFAASSATQVRMSDGKLLVIVGILFVLLILFGALFYLSKGKVGPLNYIFGAGVLYGFVASLAKVVLLRVSQGDFDLLTLLAAVALISAAILGGWFVQNAYASGPPDLVIAGLTVIDPAVAVGIGIVILGEAAEASLLQIIGFGVAGAIAAAGVVMLSKVHPELSQPIESYD